MFRTYKHFTANLNTINDRNQPMLEAIVAGTALTSAYGIYLDQLLKWSEKGSAPITCEAEAHEHFGKVLEHYKLEPKEYELRCIYKGPTCATYIENKNLVFLNMRDKPKKATIQHEVIHMIDGTYARDYDEKNALKKFMWWGTYIFYIEPRIIIRTKNERID